MSFVYNEIIIVSNTCYSLLFSLELGNYIYDFDAETHSITMRETIIVVVRSMSKTKIQQIISGLGSELLAVCFMVEMAGEDE